MTSEKKQCQNCKQDFIIEPDDFSFYEKMKVPPPTWCPGCRFARRALFRNERKLFRTVEGLHGKQILSLWPSDQGLTVYDDHDYWNFDLWDPLKYGQDFDPSRPFLAQVFEIFKKVPKLARNDINMANSDYSANASDLKNCYLMFNSNHTEDSGYGNGVDFCRSCYDNSHIQKSDRCYGSFWLTNCYETHFSSQCEDCASVWFSKNCRGLTNCFGCVNLRAKKYCFFNEQLSKEEYERRFAAMDLHTWNGLEAAEEKVKAFWLKFPNKNIQGAQNTNVSGEYINNSKNVLKSYLIRESENLKYSQYSQVPSSREVMDGSLIGCGAEFFYEVSVCGWGAANMRFCWDCWDGSRELEYCIECMRSAANLFGCVGIVKQQYCILNKQYSKDEYEKLRQKIIEHMSAMPYADKQGRIYKYGEFFPPEFSPFAYQQTIVPELFPMGREEVEKFGARWEEPSATEYQTTMSATALPDAISDVAEGITKEIIQCSECKRAYRIIEPELQFLKQVKIPIPRTCVDCRHKARISQRNRSKIYPRKCMCSGTKNLQQTTNNKYTNIAVHFHGAESCPNRFETSYSSDRPDIVYCEQCYNAEVV